MSDDREPDFPNDATILTGCGVLCLLALMMCGTFAACRWMLGY